MNKSTGNMMISYKGRMWSCESDDPNSVCTRDQHAAYKYQLR